MECPDDNTLVAFVSNELDEIQRAGMVSHLDVCESCMTIACAIARGTDTIARGSDTLAGSVQPDPYATGDRIVGRYRLDALIGAGAMGSVYVATDAQLGREIAIKIVRANAKISSARMSREARAMAQVKHPNVVTVFDAGDFDGGVFIVMELVTGETLSDWLDKPRDWREVVRVFEAAGRGLAAAHAAGIVHRDFKPPNVLVDRTGRVAVTDFGLAFAPPSATPQGLTADLAVTSTGAMLGTPLYMSPEAHLGAKVDPRADQFSFAVALYHALYGETPFARESIGGLRHAVLAGDIAARPANTQVPTAVDRVVRRALATDPEARYPTMDPLLDELARAVRPRRFARIAIAGAGIAIAAVAATLLVSSSRSPDPQPTTTSPRVAVLFDRIDNRSREPRLDGAVELAIQNGSTTRRGSIRTAAAASPGSRRIWAPRPRRIPLPRRWQPAITRRRTWCPDRSSPMEMATRSSSTSRVRRSARPRRRWPTCFPRAAGSRSRCAYGSETTSRPACRSGRARSTRSTSSRSAPDSRRPASSSKRPSSCARRSRPTPDSATRTRCSATSTTT